MNALHLTGVTAVIGGGLLLVFGGRRF